MSSKIFSARQRPGTVLVTNFIVKIVSATIECAEWCCADGERAPRHWWSGAVNQVKERLFIISVLTLQEQHQDGVATTGLYTKNKFHRLYSQATFIVPLCFFIAHVAVSVWCITAWAAPWGQEDCHPGFSLTHRIPPSKGYCRWCYQCELDHCRLFPAFSPYCYI